MLPVGQVDLFALGGAGVYFLRDDESGVLPTGKWGTTGSGTSLGFHMGGGVDVHLSPDVSLGAEVKYVLTQHTIRLDSLLFTGGLTYRL